MECEIFFGGIFLRPKSILGRKVLGACKVALLSLEGQSRRDTKWWLEANKVLIGE